MVVSGNVSIESMKLIINTFYLVQGAKFKKEPDRVIYQTEYSAWKFILKMEKQIKRIEKQKQKAKDAKRTPNKTT